MPFFPQVSQKISLERKAILVCQFSVTIWDTTQQLQLGMPWESSLLKKNKLRNSSFQAPSSPQQADGTGSTLPGNQNSREAKPGWQLMPARSSQSHLHSTGQRSKVNKPPRTARFWQADIFWVSIPPEKGWWRCRCILSSSGYCAQSQAETQLKLYSW